MRSSEFYAKKFLETVWVTSQLYDETYKVEDDLIKLFFMAQREAVEKTLLKVWEWLAKDSFTDIDDGDEDICLDSWYKKSDFLKELAPQKNLGVEGG